MTFITVPKELSKVAIVGGTGELGKYITREFLNHKDVKVRVVTRVGSNKKELINEYKLNGAEIYEIDFDSSESLNQAFNNIDVVISTVGSDAITTIQEKLIEASIYNKVKLFIPSEFGSEVKDTINPLFLQKLDIRNKIKSSGLNYVYYTNGFFIEHIISEFYGIDVKNRNAQIVGKGFSELTVTSLEDVAKFLYHSYHLPEVKNNTVYTVGENTNIKKILDDISKVTKKKFNIDYINMNEVEKTLNDPSIDFFGKISYYLRKDIEEGNIKLPSSSNHLVPDLKFTSVLQFASSKFSNNVYKKKSNSFFTSIKTFLKAL